MRTGSLDTPADLLLLGPDLVPALLCWIWVGIRTKEAGDVPQATGLRSPAKVEVRAHWDARLIQGRYLRAESRLFYITSSRDFTGQRSELAISCEELVGECAEYRPLDQVGRPCRVFLTPSAPFKDDLGQVIDYRLHGEVALVEIGRVQVDDQLLVAGQLYNVIGIAGGSDDGVVRGLWLEAVE